MGGLDLLIWPSTWILGTSPRMTMGGSTRPDHALAPTTNEITPVEGTNGHGCEHRAISGIRRAPQTGRPIALVEPTNLLSLSENTRVGSGGTSFRIRRAPAFPISSASSRRRQNRSSAAATATTVGASARKPVTPSSTISAWPATSVATTGRAHNIASTIAKGSPSYREGITSAWFVAQISSTETCPANTTRSESPKE